MEINIIFTIEYKNIIGNFYLNSEEKFSKEKLFFKFQTKSFPKQKIKKKLQRLRKDGSNQFSLDKIMNAIIKDQFS